MDKPTKWNPPTLTDALDKGVIVSMEMVAPIQGKPLKVKYQCQCGVYAWPQCFHDVRGIAGIEGLFICDGCFSSLERNLVDIDGDGIPDTTKEFKQRYLKLQGAPENLQREVGKRLDGKGRERVKHKPRGRKKWL
jgi:hypothetical protein